MATKLTKAELVFGRDSRSPTFLIDIGFLLSLSEEQLTKILDTYLESKYRHYNHHHLSRFSETVGLELDDAHTMVHLFDYFAYRVVKRNKLSDITLALEELSGEKDIENVNQFLKRLKDKYTQARLDTLDLIDDEIGTINPHFRHINYNLQNRVVIKNDEVVENLPVVTVQVITSKDDEYIFEMLEDDIDKLLKELDSIKKNLKTVKKGD